MSDERVFLTPEQAVAMLPDGDDIHTFRQGGPCLIGADWQRCDIINLINAFTPELAGEQATAMGHGLCIIDNRGPLWIKTK